MQLLAKPHLKVLGRDFTMHQFGFQIRQTVAFIPSKYRENEPFRRANMAVSKSVARCAHNKWNVWKNCIKNPQKIALQWIIWTTNQTNCCIYTFNILWKMSLFGGNQSLFQDPSFVVPIPHGTLCKTAYERPDKVSWCTIWISNPRNRCIHNLKLPWKLSRFGGWRWLFRNPPLCVHIPNETICKTVFKISDESITMHY